MEGLLALATAFAVVGLLELGDKTQLATIALAARHPWRPVFVGASLGLLASTAIGAAVGGALSAALAGNLVWVRLAGGVAFVGFGVWALARREEGKETFPADSRSALTTAFWLNFLAELGDKTQIAVVVLAASEAAPVSVFVGAGTGLVAVTALSVFIGVEVAKRLPPARVAQLSAAVFIAAGAWLIAEALLAA